MSPQEKLKAAGVAQRALARTLGMQESALSRYLRGKLVPSVKKAKAIAEATAGVLHWTDFFSDGGPDLAA